MAGMEVKVTLILNLYLWGENCDRRDLWEKRDGGNLLALGRSHAFHISHMSIKKLMSIKKQNGIKL